jgi:N-acetylglucosaminyl-diphospho-decaprenol L-rhamnosyltransferase
MILTIVVVNWNGGILIQNTINGLIGERNRSGGWFEIIVVDNASKDDSLSYLQSVLQSIKLIESHENVGFAAGCNIGAKYAQGSYILFLNPDTIVTLSTLEKVIDFVSAPKNEMFGVVGIKLVDEGGKTSRTSARFPRAHMFLLQNLGITKFLPKLGHSMKEWNHETTREVDQVIGAFFLTKRDLFAQLNGFDETFFVYFEEVDYAYRAKQLGFKSIYIADTSAFHEGEGTTSQVKAMRLFYLLRSRLLYGRKHYSLPENILNFANTLLLEPISRAAFALVSGRKSEMPNLALGFLLLYKDLPNILFRKVRSWT